MCCANMCATCMASHLQKMLTMQGIKHSAWHYQLCRNSQCPLQVTPCTNTAKGKLPAIIRHFLKGIMSAHSPIGNGWHVEDRELKVTWMTKNPAPESVLKVVHCSCKQSKCEMGRCSCMSARLSCMDLCPCQNCANISMETEDITTWEMALMIVIGKTKRWTISPLCRIRKVTATFFFNT